MSWITRNIDADLSEWLFNIRVKLPKRSLIHRDIRPDIRIDYDDLERQLAEIPEIMAFWDLVLAEVKAEVATIESRKEAIRADILDEIRKKAEETNVRISVQIMRDIVNSDNRMMAESAQLIAFQKRENQVRAIVNALFRKSESLRSLAGFKREEHKRA